MLKRIRETGSKVYRCFLKSVAIFLIYFLGAITGPEKWNLQGFVGKIAHDPKWTIPIFYFLATIVLFLMVMFTVKTFFKKE